MYASPTREKTSKLKDQLDNINGLREYSQSPAVEYCKLLASLYLLL
jgi:hypothetical protein